MSLTSKSPITARQRAANRLNALESTGPRTHEGKRNSRFNGLTHGLCAQPFRRVMTHLGEDAEEFDRFHAELVAATEPANRLEAQLVEDLALLWWKRRRSERAQAGVQVREVERLTVARERELHDVERLTMDQTAEEAHETGLRRAKDCRGKFEMALDTLDTVVARLERHRGWEECEQVMRGFYGPRPTLRGAMVLEFFQRLREGEEELPNDDDAGAVETVAGRAAREDLEQYVEEEEAAAAGEEASGREESPPGLPEVAEEADRAARVADIPGQAVEASELEEDAATTSPGEEAGSEGPAELGPGPSRTFSVRAALVQYLLEEHREIAREYELFLREHVEISEAARDACLAPTDQRWTWILRQDNYLDRQLERKIRLLDMLQERRRKRDAASEAAAPPCGTVKTSKVKNRSLQVIENTVAVPSRLARGKPGWSARRPLSGPKNRRIAPGG